MARQMVNRCLDANLRYLAYLVVAADNADAAMPRRSVQVQLKRNKARPEFQLREAASFRQSKHDHSFGTANSLVAFRFGKSLLDMSRYL